VRFLRRTLGCAVVGVLIVVGVFGIIAIGTSLPDSARLIWATVGIAALAAAFGILRWMSRSEAREDAQRSERAGPTAGSRVRSYTGPPDDAVSAFGRDARSLAGQGYIATAEEWEPMARRHPRLVAVLRFLEIAVTIATLGRYWMDFGSKRGTLWVTYQLGASPQDALAEVAGALERIRSSPGVEEA
jgi:hypothetical protein